MITNNSKLVLLCFEVARNLTVAQTALEFVGSRLLGKRKWEERKEVKMQSGCKFKKEESRLAGITGIYHHFG